jgi:hypothetical protein
MKLTRTLVLPVAAVALVVAGAGAVLASTSPGPVTTAGDVVPAAAAGQPAAGQPAAPDAATAPATAPFLTKVLDGLVTKGTITKAQEQAIVDAWVAQRTTLRQERQADRAQLRSFLADGVLTADELAQLPADSPLQQLKPLMKNGQLTITDLRAIGRGILRDLRLGSAGRLGGAPGTAPAATPAPTTATGG